MNQFLFNHDAMHYCILVHAMNYEMVNVIVNVLSFWAPMFKACGKHKYSTHLTKFSFQLKNLPIALREAVMRCWLCCPSGKEGGFQVIDWLFAFMNLYTRCNMIKFSKNEF